MSLTYYSIVADFLGRRQERRTVIAGTTVSGLLRELAGESESLRKLAFSGDGSPAGHVRLFCNGAAVTDLSQALADGDEIRLFPAISGG